MTNSLQKMSIIRSREAETSGPGYDACNDSGRTTELVSDPADCHNFYSCVDSGQGYFLAYLMHCPEFTAFEQNVQR
jgi:hypothetical protein